MFMISPKTMETKKQANIVLINIPTYSNITINNKENVKEKDINVQNLIDSIENFNLDNIYKFCFFVDNLDKFVYREIQNLDELNFSKIYNDFNEEVESK